MQAGRTILPHKSLPWTIDQLRARLKADADDLEAEVELAWSLLSMALYHRGGDGAASEALHHARRVVGLDPGHTGALTAAAGALAAMGRVDAARRYADQAAERGAAERPELLFVRGLIARAEGDLQGAMDAFEQAAHAAPRAWEPRLALALALGRTTDPRDGRAQAHLQAWLVKALSLDPPEALRPEALLALGRSLLQSGRTADAERVLRKLQDDPRHRRETRLLLGEAAYELGKYKNAIRWYEEALRLGANQASIWTRIAMAYLQLGEPGRARDAAERALVAEPGDPEARYALGCALLDDGQVPEALKALRTVLQVAPEHVGAYVELARTRRLAREVGWLVQGLRREVGQYDRLPLAPGRPSPRSVARQRIAILLGEMRELGPSTVPPILEAMDLVQDEAVRFQLWEAATAIVAGAAADEVAARLRQAGVHYGPALGRQALATADLLTEQDLVAGCDIQDTDLEQGALDRHPPTEDVAEHRRRVARERDRARAHQALVLLALASRRSRTARRFLEGWLAESDPELAVAAQAGLAMYGDPRAVTALVQRAERLGRTERLRQLLTTLLPRETEAASPELTSSGDARCDVCGRTSQEARHLMAGTRAIICDACVQDAWRQRNDASARGEGPCSFCGRRPPATILRCEGVQICTHCLDLSLGLLDRDVVDRFLRGEAVESARG